MGSIILEDTESNRSKTFMPNTVQPLNTPKLRLHITPRDMVLTETRVAAFLRDMCQFSCT